MVEPWPPGEALGSTPLCKAMLGRRAGAEPRRVLGTTAPVTSAWDNQVMLPGRNGTHFVCGGVSDAQLTRQSPHSHPGVSPARAPGKILLLPSWTAGISDVCTAVPKASSKLGRGTQRGRTSPSRLSEPWSWMHIASFVCTTNTAAGVGVLILNPSLQITEIHAQRRRASPGPHGV